MSIGVGAHDFASASCAHCPPCFDVDGILDETNGSVAEADVYTARVVASRGEVAFDIAIRSTIPLCVIGRDSVSVVVVLRKASIPLLTAVTNARSREDGTRRRRNLFLSL